MICLNLELKMESIKRQFKTTVTLDMVNYKTSKQEAYDLIGHIKASSKTFDCEERTKVNAKEKADKATTYHSKK